jgi:hypothetical protein
MSILRSRLDALTAKLADLKPQPLPPPSSDVNDGSSTLIASKEAEIAPLQEQTETVCEILNRTRAETGEREGPRRGRHSLR